ncbi:DUF4167 domain-containing protein [Rhodobacterales bacterium HKCCE4037]|nr:DUF4167 domain-containing protein [Rhodobacterales bacterium HKCCE4037]
MRSSKNRSRSKGNRNRSVGNIVNRVFDSSGPEGKVRGTPQQIIDKYNQLARDAQLGNDRVAFENFQQHAEHYTRMLAEAQREMDAKRDAQQQNNSNQNNQQGNQPNTQQGGGDGGNSGNSGNSGGGKNNRRGRNKDNDQQGGDQQGGDQSQPDAAQSGDQPAEQRSFDAVIDSGSSEDSGLVETPESAPKPKRQRRKRKAEGEDGGGEDQPPQEAAE